MEDMVTINTKLPMPLRVKVLVRFQARIFTALNLKALADSDKLEAEFASAGHWHAWRDSLQFDLLELA